MFALGDFLIVVRAFLSHFKGSFSQPVGISPVFDANFLKTPYFTSVQNVPMYTVMVHINRGYGTVIFNRSE